MDSGAWDERYAGTDLVWTAEPNQFVVAELSDLPPGSAYDMACGEGRNAIWLARRGWHVTATDFSGVALEKGRTLATHQPDASALDITWVRADVTDDGPTPGSYDLVLLAYLQLPGQARTRAIRAAAQALRPGGTLLIVAHDSTNIAEGYGGPQDPAVLCTAADVLTDVQGIERLEIRRAERLPRAVTVDSTEHTAWDVLVRLRRVS